MSDELRAEYQRKIDDPATPDPVRAWLQSELAALPPAPSAPDRPTNTASPAAATVGDANAITDATAAIGNTTGGDFTQNNQSGGINFQQAEIAQMGDPVARDKIVNQFFGGKPPPNGPALLHTYLDRIIENNSDLHLYRMTKSAKSGSGQDVLPPLKLADVYTNVVVDGADVPLFGRTRSAARARKLSGRVKQRSLDEVAPERVRVFAATLSDAVDAAWRTRHPTETLTFDTLEDDVPVEVALMRPPLALESIALHPRLVLLGEPGYGKSTILRYLALMLAHHQRDPAAPLPLGWQTDDPLPVPLFCSLAVAADGLRDSPASLTNDAKLLWAALQQQLEGIAEQGAGLRDHLRGAIDAGGVVLLLDGLDELSAAPDAHGLSLRARMSAAIAQLAREFIRVSIVVTCRVLPYAAVADPAYPRNRWQLPPDGGWITRTIQPFARGQVRQFVQAWYTAASQHPQARYRLDEATQRSERLASDLENQRVQVLTRSPLLLTMLAILHYNRANAVLPTTEAELYEECVTLLLERWEPVRTLEHRKLGLLEELGLADTGKTLGDIRSILHKVAFDAHNRPPDPSDGRGMVRDTELEGELRKAFRIWKCDDVDGKITTFVRVLRENAALLHELDDDRYAFPHLTFQEFLAACQLADTGDLERAYRVWDSPDGDRWRVVLLLFAGRLRSDRKVDPTGEAWLRMLLRKQMPRDKHGCSSDKTPRQRQRDALLAYASYDEFDRRSALLNRDSEELDELERVMAQALLTVVAPEPLATTAERVAAGFALGTLGDPRPGVGDLNISWCDVPAGAYTLGSDDRDPAGQDDEKPLQTVTLAGFRIARYPVTNAQWGRFMAAGGYTDRQWWSDQGWEARAQGLDYTGEPTDTPWSQPEYWADPQFNAPNQPVVGVAWYEVEAFCAWLGQRLGYAVQLPTEAQWEAAARGPARPIYSWGNEWEADRANTTESDLNRTTAVGSYPQGASWCGALDMAGNVWEWTRSDYNTGDRTNEIDIMNNRTFVSVRGGAWLNHRQNARGAYRYGDNPHSRNNTLGVRRVTPLTK